MGGCKHFGQARSIDFIFIERRHGDDTEVEYGCRTFNDEKGQEQCRPGFLVITNGDPIVSPDIPSPIYILEVYLPILKTPRAFLRGELKTPRIFL